MAEAVAVVGVVASIVQLIHFSTRVACRLQEFHSVAGGIPRSFRLIKTELPLLETTLQQLKGAIDADLVVDGSKKALLPAIAGCYEQIEQLDTILSKALPKSDDSWRKIGKKAIMSPHYDAKAESITRILRNYIGTLTFYYAAASSTLQPLTGRFLMRKPHKFYSDSFVDAKLCKIRKWLSAPDPSINFQRALKERYSDTGLWFLESEEYTRWKTDAASPLWLYGIPGCGKTVLSATVLQNVLQHCHHDPGKVTAYFFFDFNDAQKQNPELMLRSLLGQFSQQSINIPTSLDVLFSLCDSGQRQPSVHALLEALRPMVQELPNVYIIIDALDECVQRVELMDILETMAGWQLQNLHLLVTSRKERDIESSLEGFIDGQDRVCLQSTLVDKDIKRYVRQRLSTDKNLQKWQKDDAIRQEIEVVLQTGAHGMSVRF
jgi:Cdc6-like AAA superfamily ATPase